MQKELVISTYSFLMKYGGGIESWLQKLLNNRDVLYNLYSKIYIIGLDSDNDDSISKDYNDSRLKFFLFENKGKFRSLINYIFAVRRLLALKEKSAIDIIFVGTLYPSLPILFLPKGYKSYIWLRAFFKYEINSLSLKKFKKTALFLEKCCLKRAHKIIANGQDTKKLYEMEYKTINDIIVIPNAVEPGQFKVNTNVLRKPIVTIAFIGRFYKEKGVDAFIESIKRINLKQPDNNFKFIFVGWGECSEDVHLLSSLFKNVDCLGKINNSFIPSFLSNIDITVNLTYSNINIGGAGLSNSLLESIFADNLIIAWDNFCYNQILNNDNAICIKENDIEGLVNAYKYIDENRRDCILRIQNMHSLKKDYTFETHMSKLIEVLK